MQPTGTSAQCSLLPGDCQQTLLGNGRTDHYASIVPVPRQRNKREENATIKAGDTPEAWKEKPARAAPERLRCPLDRKNGQSHYGDKNHINVDRRHKLVRDHDVSDAAVHDSQVPDQILDGDNTASDVRADSACRSAEIEEKLKDKGLRSRIHRKASATSH